MVRLLTFCALATALLIPATAMADPDAPGQHAPETSAGPARSFAVPAGAVRLAHTEISAAAPRPIRFSVALDRAPANAKLEIQLPRRFGSRSLTGLPFTGAPRLVSNPDGQVDLTRKPGTLLMNLDSAPSGTAPTVEIPDIGLPAGTYDLPLTWVAPDGTASSAGVAHVVIHAGTREGGSPSPVLGPVRAIDVGGTVEDSSSDSDEESEDFIAVDPSDPNRLATAANDITGSSTKGVWLSDDGGHTFTTLNFTRTLDQPGTTSNQSASLGGDPILAADDQGNVWAGGLTNCVSSSNPSRIFVERIAAGSNTFGAAGVGLPLLHNRCTSTLDDIQDKPMMTIDNWSGNSSYGRLAVTWDDPDPSGGVNEVISFCDTRPGGVYNPANCDNADHWSGPTAISSGPGSYITSDPTFGPDGTVYVVWWDYSSNNGIYVTSCPAATTDCTNLHNWTGPQVAVALSSGAAGLPVPFACPTWAQPGGRAAPVPSIAFDSTGRVYLSWSDLRTNSTTVADTRCTYNNTTGAMSPPSALQETFDSYVTTASSLSGITGASQHDSPHLGTSIVGDTGNAAASPTDPTPNGNSDDWFPWIAVDQSNDNAFVDVWSTKADGTRKTARFYLSSVTPPGSGTQPTISAPQEVSNSASDYSGDTCCTFGNDYGDYTGNAAAGGWDFPVWDKRPMGGAGEVMTYAPANPFAPQNEGAPSITGLPDQDQTLTAVDGFWTGNPTFSYDWQSCDSAGGNCSDTGVTTSTYPLGAGDVGKTLEVVVTGANGTSPAGTATSPASPVIKGPLPANTTLPAISGTPAQQGQPLSTDDGTWSNSPTSFAYQWRRCDSSGSNCVDIAGATSNTYTPVAADVGSTLRSGVSATNANGTSPTPAYSDPTAAVLIAAPANTTAPPVYGPPNQGQTLTGGEGGWTNSPTSYDNQWRRCDTSGTTCTDISGATSLMYTLTSDDVGHTIVLRVTAHNDGGMATKDSAPTATILGPLPGVSVAPVVTGTAQAGATLSTDDGSWTDSPTSFTYRWQRCGPDGNGCAYISGATARTYTATFADVGSTLRSAVSATNANGTSNPASSSPTATVLPAPPAGIAPPTITGATVEGQMLSGRPGSWTGSPTGYSYQWRRCNPGCNDVPGATGLVYRLSAADVGARMVFHVTAANAGGSGVNDSAPTAVIVTAPPAVLSPPSISGVAAPGSLLTGVPGAWSGGPQLAFQWLRCNPGGSGCAAIPGATGTTYTPTSADLGHSIVLRITATDPGGTATALSTPTPTVKRLTPLSVSVNRTQSRSAILRSGLAFRSACQRGKRCRVHAVLLLRPPKGSRAPTFTLASLTRTLKRPARLRLRLGRTARNRLLHGGRRRLVLQVTATQSGHRARTRTVTFRLKR